MSNERYNQIIDNAYNNYTQTKIIKTDSGETHISPSGHYNGMAKEEFINKIKINPKFSETWGLKIEERELSLEERMKIWQNQQDGRGHFIIELLDNIPTKQITLIYNNETIESYE